MAAAYPWGLIGRRVIKEIGIRVRDNFMQVAAAQGCGSVALRALEATCRSHYRARYYDPVAGRFVSEDRIELEGGINLYRYSNNNPIILADAFGLAPNNPIDRIIQQLQNLFPGSTYDQTTNTLVIPQDPSTVQSVLLAQGYQEPGQWWNPFLYWDPVFHAGGSESRSGNQTGSFHFRQQYPVCPMGGHGPFQYMGPRNKTILDQFHVDSSNPAVDPLGHILHDFLHIPRW